MVSAQVDAQPHACPESLLDSIDQQAAAYRHLLALSRSKQEMLIQGDVAALARLLPEEQQALLALQGLEARYLRACADYARQLGIPVSYEYGHLADAVGEPWSSLLRARLEELAGLGRDLTLLVVSNGELIRRARSLIEFTLSQADRVAGTEGYDSGGGRRATGAVPSAISRQL